MNDGPLLASELYAISQGSRCVGPDRCHWCGAPCQRHWIHDDPPSIPFKRRDYLAKFPSNSYICAGCWLWRRQRTTITFPSGRQMDGQAAPNHSWWISEGGAFALDEASYRILADKLIQPPLTFSLMLLSNAGLKNHLQLGNANNHTSIRAETPLLFTLDNITHVYTVYELEMAIKTGVLEGKSPGTSALIRHLNIPVAQTEEERERGRPTSEESHERSHHRVIRGEKKRWRNA